MRLGRRLPPTKDERIVRPPTEAAIYARFSPRRVKKDENGNPIEVKSNDTQIEMGRQYCDFFKIKIATLPNGEPAIFTDEFKSGKEDRKRQGLQDAIEFACKHKIALITYTASRFGRNTLEALRNVERLHEGGARLICLRESFDAGTPFGHACLTILLAIAQIEREDKVVITRDHMLSLQDRGVRITAAWNTPFGFKVDPNNASKIIECPEEQSLISRVFELAGETDEDGQLISMREIARRMNSEGVRHRNATWTASQVSRILNRRR